MIKMIPVLVTIQVVGACKSYADTIMAHHKIYQGIGQILPDISGNGYHMVNGNSLDTDAEDVIWTERGAYIDGGRGLYLAPPSISFAGFALPTTFTMTVWAYIFRPTSDFCPIFQKGGIFRVRASTILWAVALYFDSFLYPYFTYVNFGKFYLDKWYLITVTLEDTPSQLNFRLFLNDEQKGPRTFNDPWTDSGSELFVFGTSMISNPQKAFIYEFIVYDGLVPTSEISAGHLYFENSSCVYPNFRTECISDCEDPHKEASCSNPCPCTGGCTETLECLECDPVCENFCTSSTSCYDIVAVCYPSPYEPNNFACNFAFSCIQNCSACQNGSECTICDSGFALQPDLTCIVGCPMLYFESNGVCVRCHDDCTTCSGSSQSDCTACMDSNSFLLSSPGACECASGYFANTLDPLSCGVCHSDCDTCDGPLDNNCLSCSSNVQLQGTSCVCNPGFYESQADPLQCSSCHADCAECTGPSQNECSVCSDTNASVQAGACVCNTGFYQSSSCSACDAECETCNGPSQTQCLSCSDPLKVAESGVCSCMNGYFLDPVSGCLACDSECATCTGQSDSDCLTCSDPNKEFDGSNCVCRQSFFLDNGDCEACHSDCASCLGSLQSECQTCADSLKETLIGSCVCIAGYYSDSSNQCQVCHSDCATCVGPNQNNCSSCPSPSMNLSGGSCVCPAGSFVDTGSCSSCHSECATCTGPLNTDCSSCAYSNASVVSGTCVCDSGFYLDGTTCAGCHSDCATCSGPLNTDCLSCTDPDKSTVSGSCECNSGLYSNGASCSICHSDCATCTGPLDTDCSNCTDSDKEVMSGACVCKAGLYLNGAVCSICHSDCATCTGPLDTDCSSCTDPDKEAVSGSCMCMSGYFSVGASCSACHSDCSTCTGSLDSECQSCTDSDKELNSGSCVCKTNGFYPNGAACGACDSDCLTCSGPLNSDCLTCTDSNKKLNYGSCVCKTNYYVNGATCGACDSDCLTCSGPLSSDCLTCTDSNKELNYGSCVCKTSFYEDGATCGACDSDCLTCSGPLNSDCLTCTDSNKELNTGSCVCKGGFYENSSSCSSCFEGCMVCSGPEESDCINCDFPNGYVKGSMCSCEDGFYLSGTEECSTCSSNCKTCNGPLSSDCLTCTESSSLNSSGECVCAQGFYVKELSPLECEKCPEKCETCDESNCLSCSSPETKLEDNCDCEEGYYLSENNQCEECSSECTTCSEGSECTGCVDPQKEAVEGVCKCKSDYCEEGGKCKECGAIPEETELTTEGQVGAASVGVALGISFISMVTLDDPTVLWTIANISQIICYLSILEVPISGSFYQFMLSYQSMGFMPNIFISLEGSVEPPASYQKFGYLKEEYVNTNFLRNSGRILFFLAAIMGTILILFLISFILKGKCKEKLRNLGQSWVGIFQKLLLTVLLDMLIPSSLVVFSSSSSSESLSPQLAMVIFSMYCVYPILLLMFIKYKEKIKNEDETVMKYIGSLYKNLNLESDLTWYYELFMVLRRITLAIALYFYHRNPCVVLIIQLIFSVFFFLYISLGKIFIQKVNTVINALAEVVLSLTVVGLIVIDSSDSGRFVEYFLMGLNIGFILSASSLSMIVAGLTKICKKKEEEVTLNTIICLNSNLPGRVFEPSIKTNSLLANQRLNLGPRLILNRKQLTNNIIFLGEDNNDQDE